MVRGWNLQAGETPLHPAVDDPCICAEGRGHEAGAAGVRPDVEKVQGRLRRGMHYLQY